jgi:hypothetical protein
MNYFQKAGYVSFFFLGCYTYATPARAQEAGWKCIKHADSIWVYASKSNTANCRIIKVTTWVKAKLSSLVLLLTDAASQNKWVYNNKKTEIIDKESVFSWHAYSQTHLPWPVCDRDVVASVKLTQDSVTKAVTISSKAIPEYLPKDSNHVRVPYARIKWQLVPAKNHMIKAQCTLEIDAGGHLPKWLVRLTAAKGPYQTMRNLRKEIRQKKYQQVRLSYIKEP